MRHFGAVFRAIKIAPPPNQQLPASPVKSAFASILTATKKFGQLRKLSPIPGVLPRQIVSDPRKEYLSIFSRAIFSTPWYFRGRPNFGVLGRFEGGFRPGATSLLALSCRAKQARLSRFRYSRGGLLFPVGWDRTSFQTAVISTTASGRDSNGVVANLFAIAIKMRRFSLGSLTESITPSPATET